MKTMKMCYDRNRIDVNRKKSKTNRARRAIFSNILQRIVQMNGFFIGGRLFIGRCWRFLTSTKEALLESYNYSRRHLYSKLVRMEVKIDFRRKIRY